MGSSQPEIKRSDPSLPAGITGDSSVAKPLINRWEIRLDTWPRKLLALILVCVVCGALIHRTWWVFLAAWMTRQNLPDPSIYELAIQYDPNNADYHFWLAQIYNYSTQHLSIARAGELYETAVRLNPNRSEHWLELSKYYEQAGDIERSRFAMTKALERDPNYAQTHWAAANLYLRLNDFKAADHELRRTADLDIAYLIQVLDLVWQVYANPDRIISTHIPNTKEANLTALNFFVNQKSERGTSLSWLRLKTFKHEMLERYPYVEYLLAINKPREAWGAFVYPLAESTPLFFNPSFETQPVSFGFDWLFSTLPHAEGRRDTGASKTGIASWLVTFDGEENLDYYQGLQHRLATAAGRQYNLSFWMKTEGITTNEGVFVEVDGQESERQVGTNYWRQFTIPFSATSDLVLVRLRRVPSKKFDNLLKGKVWLDDFELVEVRQ